MQEKIDRLRRQNNLVIMGIEENSSEVNTLASLFSIIWPQGSFENRYTRVGPQIENAAHPRPIRVEIPSFLEKKQIISNCRKLKGVTTLKGISVKNDMTKTQQQEHKERMKKKKLEPTAIETRSKTQKRKNEDNSESPHPTKKSNEENEA